MGKIRGNGTVRDVDFELEWCKQRRSDGKGVGSELTWCSRRVDCRLGEVDVAEEEVRSLGCGWGVGFEPARYILRVKVFVNQALLYPRLGMAPREKEAEGRHVGYDFARYSTASEVVHMLQNRENDRCDLYSDLIDPTCGRFTGTRHKEEAARSP